MPTCTKCQQDKPTERFSQRKDRDELRHYCKDCANEGERERRARLTPEERYAHERRKRLWRFHRIRPDEYDAMLAAQDSRCAICETKNPAGRWGLFVVDHDHDTGKIRGLLCNRCNKCIGQLDDDPDLLRKAAAYLESR